MTTNAVETKMVNYFDNKVYFSVNRTLRREEVAQVKLYFEANECSGGSDEIVEFKYEEKNKVLEIDYQKNVTKQGVLRRRHFNYQLYEFEAFENTGQNYHAAFTKLNNMLVVENIDKMHPSEDVEAYLNYLVRRNKIARVDFSTIFSNLLYVEFEEGNLNIDEIQKYLARNPTFKDRFVHLHEVYETNAVVLKLNNNKISEYVDYFSKNFIIENECHWQVPFDYADSPFMIIKFKNTLVKQRFVSVFRVSHINDVSIENLVNIDLLNERLTEWSKTAADADVVVIHQQDDGEFTTISFSDPNAEERSFLTVGDTNQDEENSAMSYTLQSVTTAKKFMQIGHARKSIFRRRKPAEYPKRCHLCPFKAYQSKYFETHLKNHEENNAYRCRFCSFSCQLKMAMDNHERLHFLTPETDGD